jgi:uncharacterized oligopeptide transporter (OPT) family protein
MFGFLNEQAQATLAAVGVYSIADMSPDNIWNYFIRYIGAGAVAFGGIITLIRSIPTIVESFRLGSKELLAGTDHSSVKRTDRDLSIKVVLWLSVLMIVLLGLSFTFGLEQITVAASILAAILVVIFAFFFVTVASRIVGLVGSTSSPVSGMTIATLLGTSSIRYDHRYPAGNVYNICRLRPDFRRGQDRRVDYRGGGLHGRLHLG